MTKSQILAVHGQDGTLYKFNKVKNWEINEGNLIVFFEGNCATFPLLQHHTVGETRVAILANGQWKVAMVMVVEEEDEHQ